MSGAVICAIVDLSDKVFAEGMAYVALPSVRLLAGLHLIAYILNLSGSV